MLLLAGAASFVLGLILHARSGDLFASPSPGTDTYSRSLVGHHALAELLERAGFAVVQSRSRRSAGAGPAFPLLVLEPALRNVDFAAGGDWAGGRPVVRLERLVGDALDAGAPVVLALPKRRYIPSVAVPGWIADEELLPVAAVQEVLDAAEETRPADGEEVDVDGGAELPAGARALPEVVRRHGPFTCRAPALGRPAVTVSADTPLQLLTAARVLQPLVACGDDVLVGRVETSTGGPLFLVADPDLFNNRGLGRGDHATVVVRLLADVLGAEGVVFEETVHGHVSRGSLLARAVSFPAAPLTLHAVLLGVFAVWARSGRFGRELPPAGRLAGGKAVLVENTALLLRSVRDPRAAVEPYARGLLQELGRRWGAAGGRAGGEAEEELLRKLRDVGRSRGVADDPAELLRAAREKAVSPREALRLCRRLHEWREELLQRGAPAPDGRASAKAGRQG